MRGDRANMPAMCRLIVRPMTERAEPWSSMWTEVSAMTATITACDDPIAQIAVNVRPRMWGSAARMPRAAGAASAACTRGSGRSRRNVRTPATAKPAAENTTGPARSGSPSRSANAAPGPVRLGPTTAPTVVDHTTSDRARPIWSGAARSTAAKRDCRLAAVLAPNSVRPARMTHSDSSSAPRTTMAAPSAPLSQPRVSAGRRPVRAAIEDSGIVNAAAPERQHHDRHAGPAGGAADVLDQDRSDREPGTVADPADDLHQRKHRDDPPLRRIRR